MNTPASGARIPVPPPFRGGGAAPGLVKSLGLIAFAAGIFNCTVGGGIFRLPSSVANMVGGAGLIVYGVCAVAMALIALCFAEAGSRVSGTGGPYAIVERVFGPFAGFLIGVLAWSVGTLSLASVSTAFIAAVGAALPVFQGPGMQLLLVLGVFALLAVLNVRGVQQGARLINVLTVAKLLPMLVLIGAGVWVLGADAALVAPAREARVPEASSIARAAMVLIFAFSGIESALAPSGEVRNPERNIPRAIFLAIGLVTLLYMALHSVGQALLGPEALAKESAAPLAAAAAVALGPTGRALLLIGALISMAGYLSAMTLAVPRTLYVLGRDGVLPRVLGQVHPLYRTPALAILVQCGLVAYLALTSSFDRLVIMTNAATLILFGSCVVAAWQLKRTIPSAPAGFTLPLGGLVHVGALAIIGWLLTAVSVSEWILVGMLMVGASLLYWARRGHVRGAFAWVGGRTPQPGLKTELGVESRAKKSLRR